MRSTHKLVTILVAIVVIAVNIAILHVLFALLVKHHNNYITCYKNIGFSYLFGDHSHWDPKKSDCGLHIWSLVHYIPHFVMKWDPH